MSSPSLPVESLTLNPRRASIPLHVWLAVGAISAFWILLGSMVVDTAREHDFLNLYTGGALVRDGQLPEMHHVDVQLAKERTFVPGTRQLIPFVRLPVYGLLLSPLSWLPFGTAFWVWLAVQVGVLLAIWRWIAQEFGAESLILASLFPPTVLGIAHGQDCVLMAAVVLGVYVLMRRESDFAAGAVLGLGLIKFHLFLLWPLALIVQKKWRAVAGAAMMVAIEFGLSLLLVGPAGLRDYFSLLLRDDLAYLMPSEELMLNLRSVLLNLGLHSPPLEAIGIAAVVALTGWTCWNAPLWRWLAAISLGSLLIVPHVYGYDAALLLVPAMVVVYRADSKIARATAGALLMPIPLLMPLFGSPWAVLAPVALLACLVSLAPWGQLRSRATNRNRISKLAIPSRSRSGAGFARRIKLFDSSAPY